MSCASPRARVSHRIRQLEPHLGIKLFGRSDFNLTADGAVYLANVRTRAGRPQAVPNRGATRRTTQLRLAVTPTFSRQLLMPHLELFRNIYPDIELVMQCLDPAAGRHRRAGRTSKCATAAATTPTARTGWYSRNRWCRPAARATSTSLGPFTGFRTEAEIAAARLIRSPLEPWSTWFASCGLDHPEPRSAPQFNDLGLVYDAAASGFGVALVRQKLGAQWLESGRLVPLSGPARALAAAPLHLLAARHAGALGMRGLRRVDSYKPRDRSSRFQGCRQKTFNSAAAGFHKVRIAQARHHFSGDSP